MLKIRFLYLSIFLLLGCSSNQLESKVLEFNTPRITIEDKIAQMIMIRMDGKYHSNDSWKKSYIEDIIKEYNIGGLIAFTGNVHGTFANIKEYQDIAKTPMFIASDYERGLGVFIDGTLFPSNMAIAATQDTTLAYLQGQITAREAKALGVNMVLAPVLDINNNKDNPIINFRAYSDSPSDVVKFSIPFIRGIQDQGLIACAKHFPGHGNTDTDSHTSLPIIDIDKNELFENELHPFKKACNYGVRSVMIGHIVIPSIDDYKTPATFSKKITTGILRDKWSYNGLIITDALEMGALTKTTWSGESAVKSIEAGADIVLLPLNAKVAINSIINAVKSGRITEDRINKSYERIIKEKERLGILDKYNDWSEVEQTIGLSKHKNVAANIAKKSITLVKNKNKIIPFNPNKYKKVSHILLSTDSDLRTRLKSFARDIDYIHGNVQKIYVNDSLSDLAMKDVINKISSSDVVIVSMLIRISMDKGLSTIHDTHNELLKKIEKLKIPIIGISFGSPYLPDYGYLDAYLCSYGYGSVSLDATTDALFGRKDITGKLPVDLNQDYRKGHGVIVKKNDKIFESNLDLEFPDSFSIINDAISDSIFPGAQLFVAKGNNILVNKPFGKFTYNPNSEYVTTESIYDVASLTKVLSTTPVVMKLVQKKLLSTNYYLSDFYESFNYGDKKNITVRHLLTHSSGLPAYIEYYKNDYINSKKDIVNHIINLDLEYTPDTKTVYSDLGIILLYDIIEKVSSSSLDNLSNRYFYRPFGMKNTFFNPPLSYKDKIAPTELDTYYRNRLLIGEVHDENAFMLGGVSGHAGLFSNAEDIGKMSKFFLNEGVYLGRRYLKKNIINHFTARKSNPVLSDRALGWDTPSRNGKSSAGDYFSYNSYGHLGFTGTSVWIDPDRDIIIVFLTNRVYPTRSKNGMYNVRRNLHNSLMKNILEY